MSQLQQNLSQSQRHSQMSQSQRDSQMSQSQQNLLQSQRDSQRSQSQHNLSQSRKPRQNMSQSQNLYRNTKGPMCSLNASICSAPSPSQHRGGPVSHSQSQRTHQSQHMSNPQPLHGHPANPLQIRVPAHPRLTPTPQGYSQGIRNSNDGSHRSHPGRPLHRTDSMSSSLSKMSTTPSLSSCQSRITTTPSLNNSMRSESSRSRCPSDRVKKLNLTPQMCALQSSRTPQQMVQGTSKYPLTQKINFLQMQRQASQQSQHGDPLRHGGMKRNETNERMDRNNNALKLQNGMINRRPSASRSSQEERERSKQFTQSPFTKYRKPQSSPAILNTPHFQSGGKPPNVNTPLSASSGTPTPPNGYRLVSPRTSSSLSSSNSRSRQEVPYNRPSGGSRPNEQRIQEGACRKSMGSSRPVEMKTPSHSPVYKQSNPAPPFQETLKMLTAAIKKSKI
uniref:Uncharacterized protein n=1 Tax=Cacopsylla melanoneura TaxID=428564 RepID=A0A8D8Z659_9HEMI